MGRHVGRAGRAFLLCNRVLLSQIMPHSRRYSARLLTVACATPTRYVAAHHRAYMTWTHAQQRTYMEPILVDAFLSIGYDLSWNCQLAVDRNVFVQFDVDGDGAWSKTELARLTQISHDKASLCGRRHFSPQRQQESTVSSRVVHVRGLKFRARTSSGKQCSNVRVWLGSFVGAHRLPRRRDVARTGCRSKFGRPRPQRCGHPR